MKPKTKPKHYNKINAVFYSLSTLTLLIVGFILGNACLLTGGIILLLVSVYWFRKVINKGKGK